MNEKHTHTHTTMHILWESMTTKTYTLNTIQWFLIECAAGWGQKWERVAQENKQNDFLKAGVGMSRGTKAKFMTSDFWRIRWDNSGGKHEEGKHHINTHCFVLCFGIVWIVLWSKIYSCIIYLSFEIEGKNGTSI